MGNGCYQAGDPHNHFNFVTKITHQFAYNDIEHSDIIQDTEIQYRKRKECYRVQYALQTSSDKIIDLSQTKSTDEAGYYRNYNKDRW